MKWICFSFNIQCTQDFIDNSNNTAHFSGGLVTQIFNYLIFLDDLKQKFWTRSENSSEFYQIWVNFNLFFWWILLKKKFFSLKACFNMNSIICSVWRLVEKFHIYENFTLETQINFLVAAQKIEWTFSISRTDRWMVCTDFCFLYRYNF